MHNGRLAALGSVLANLFEVLSGMVMILILINVVKEDTYSLLTTIMIVGLIIACVAIVAGVVLYIAKNGIKAQKGSRKKVASNTFNENSDKKRFIFI